MNSRKRNRHRGIKMHKVVKIDTDYAFCLHSKERVPYHIIIEVLYDQEDQEKSNEKKKEQYLNLNDSAYTEDENNHFKDLKRRIEQKRLQMTQNCEIPG